VAREALDVRLEGRGAACDWSDRNAECLGEPCPFHRHRAGSEGAPIRG
jgi:hypothetical protein